MPLLCLTVCRVSRIHVTYPVGRTIHERRINPPLTSPSLNLTRSLNLICTVVE